MPRICSIKVQGHSFLSSDSLGFGDLGSRVGFRGLGFRAWGLGIRGLQFRGFVIS